MSTASELKTGIEEINDGMTWGGEHWYQVWLCGEKMCAVVGAGRAKAKLVAVATNRGIDLLAARAAYVAALENETPVPPPTPAPVAQAPVEALPVEPVTVTERHAQQKAHCAFYRSIKRFYAICIEHGISTDDATVTALLSKLLERSIESRKSLSGSEWERAGSMLKWRGAAAA